MARILTPKVIVQPPKEIKKEVITETYDITTEIKVLRETIAQLLQKVEIDNPTEFNEYNNTIINITKSWLFRKYVINKCKDIPRYVKSYLGMFIFDLAITYVLTV